MTKLVQFFCRNCGNRFEAMILDDDEMREARSKNRPTSPVRCPQCNRSDVRVD